MACAARPRPGGEDQLFLHSETLVVRGEGLAIVRRGLNNEIRVLQHRAYDLRDQEYLRLKVPTCMLPAL
ncbi:MAG: hypothetical protein U1E60_09585 [Reyranellaceae bacterium]